MQFIVVYVLLKMCLVTCLSVYNYMVKPENVFIVSIKLIPSSISPAVLSQTGPKGTIDILINMSTLCHRNDTKGEGHGDLERISFIRITTEKKFGPRVTFDYARPIDRKA